MQKHSKCFCSIQLCGFYPSGRRKNFFPYIFQGMTIAEKDLCLAVVNIHGQGVSHKELKCLIS